MWPTKATLFTDLSVMPQMTCLLYTINGKSGKRFMGLEINVSDLPENWHKCA
jgi:hypothetical protein